MTPDKLKVLKSKVPDLIFHSVLPDIEKMAMSDSDIIMMADPDSVDWEIRVRMTRLLEKVGNGGIRVYTLDDFHKGICNVLVFKKRLKQEWKRTFYTRPLHTFEQATDNIITAITSRFYEITNLPITTVDGNGKKTVDHKNARLMMDLAKLMLDRKHGQAVQRQVVAKAPSVPRIMSPTPTEVEEEITALEAEFEEPKRISVSVTTEEEGEGVTTVPGE